MLKELSLQSVDILSEGYETATRSNIKESSFESSENIQTKESGPYFTISDNESSSVTSKKLAMKPENFTAIS